MAYSQDLRERVVRAVERGERSQKEIAEDYEVSLSFVERNWRRYRETGQIGIKRWHHGRSPRLAGAGEERLRTILTEHPDRQLEELCQEVKDEDGKAVSVSTMSRMLNRLGISHKKNNSVPVSKIRPASRRYATTLDSGPQHG
jgi:transposase